MMMIGLRLKVGMMLMIMMVDANKGLSQDFKNDCPKFLSVQI